MAFIKILECAEDLSQLKFKNTFIARLNGEHAKTSKELYKQLSKALELPDYFGNNLDALYDCMMDLEWITQDNIVLIIENFETLLSGETNDPDFKADFVLLLDEVGFGRRLNSEELIKPKEFSTIIVASDTIVDLCDENDIASDILNVDESNNA